METINDNELSVVGLQRCGQHAVIHWVMSQARGRRLFLNDVKPGANPMRSFAGREYEARGYWRRFDLGAEQDGRFTHKSWLIYNYEDEHPRRPFAADFEACRESWLGRSARRLCLLVLRDPCNFFASRLRWGRSPSAGWSKRPLQGESARAELVSLWKAHAREYLGDTQHLPAERVLVNYNRWASERAYRRELAARLGLRFSDRGRSHVPDYGPGSSFDGRRFHWRAQRMQVLDRYRHFLDDPFYRAIFDDQELCALARRAFGSDGDPVALLGGARA